MDKLVLALIEGTPFSQWSSIHASDVVPLLPWLLLIMLLVTRGGVLLFVRVPVLALLFGVGAVAVAFTAVLSAVLTRSA